VLILTQDGARFVPNMASAHKIILNATDGTLGEWVMWKLVSVCLETLLVFMQYLCTVCTERTIGLEIVLDALDGTPR
jgi:hypothetical protein